MARIRSIHPSLWTDEAFMALSAHARLLLLGVWTEADDDGVFDYKPLTLKARLFPADNVDVEALLSELERINWIERFENGPKGGYGTRYYAACKNLRRYQRPKKPNTRGLLPEHLRTYVGLSETSSPPVPHQFPTGTEQPQQMEEGRGRMEEVVQKASPSGADAPSPAEHFDLDADMPESLRRKPIALPSEDLKGQVFGPVLTWLAGKTGKPPDKHRSTLGLWCKQFGEGAVLEVGIAAQRENPLEPIGWMKAALETRNGNRTGKTKSGGGWAELARAEFSPKADA